MKIPTYNSSHAGIAFNPSPQLDYTEKLSCCNSCRTIASSVSKYCHSRNNTYRTTNPVHHHHHHHQQRSPQYSSRDIFVEVSNGLRKSKCSGVFVVWRFRNTHILSVRVPEYLCSARVLHYKVDKDANGFCIQP
ncbi:hypothetical protein ACOME3_003061 [Neoechinorhynchus agilis]